MVRIKKVLAIIVALTLIISIMPEALLNLTSKAYGATTLTLSIASDSAGKRLLTASQVTLEWDNMDTDYPGTVYSISYSDSFGTSVNVTDPSKTLFVINPASKKYNYTITNLKTDFVYNFTVTAFIGGPNPPLSASKKAITGITFDVVCIPQTATDVLGGGKEIGTKPKLKFNWNIPKTWNGSAVVNYDPAAIDYNIFIGTDAEANNKNPLQIRYSSAISQYIATRTSEGIEIKTIAQSVNYSNIGGFIEFFSDGVDDPATSPLVRNPIVADGNHAYSGAEAGFNSNNQKDIQKLVNNHIAVHLNDIYADEDINPGTVYKMSIVPTFVNELNVDGTSRVAYRESQVNNGYTFTTIRFALHKEGVNDIKAEIYKINQKGLTASSIASFSYSVQYSKTIDFSDFTTSAMQKDEFSPGNTLKIFIENSDSDHIIYYRVIATAPLSGQFVFSDPIPYVTSLDTSTPPLPENLQVTQVIPVSGTVINDFLLTIPVSPVGSPLGYPVKSANIKIRWKKPSDYNNIIANNALNPVYYHILLSSAQSDSPAGTPAKTESIGYIFGDVGNTKSYYIKYRDIVSVNIGACNLETDQTGDYLSFIIDGTNLFNTIDQDTYVSQDPLNPYNGLAKTSAVPVNSDNYPTYLLPNRSYYIKMYATKGAAQPSSNSIGVSVTTPLDIQKDPPSPINFKDIKDKNIIVNPGAKNSVTLEWKKIGFNVTDYTSNTSATGNDYYELYMCESLTGTYLPIGDTNIPNGDVNFIGLGGTGKIIDAVVSQLTGPGMSSLMPNRTYYFKVRTRVEISGEAMPRYSRFSNIVAITTVRGDIIPPDNSEKKPMVPDDALNKNRFSIALDSSGNRMINSSGVTVRWPELEQDVKYTLIRTAKPIKSNDSLSAINADPENNYKVYFQYDGRPVTGSDFTYDSIKSEFMYKANDLLPNSIYYFSLRAERIIDVAKPPLTSNWITIPVTTALIESPQLLQIVLGNEIGISWNAGRIFNYDSFSVSIAENSTGVYTGVKPEDVLISEDYNPTDTTMSRFYARILSLKPATSYNVRISGSTKDANGGPVAFYQDIPNTRVDNITNTVRTITADNMHELDIKWKGKDNYDFELAIKGETDDNYTTLTLENGGFKYMSKEKSVDLIGTDYTMYYARIPNLKSNTMYYIKVRSKKTNENYSKYVGPVNSRTEFSQADYDKQEQGNKENAGYADKVKMFNEMLYWPMENSENSYKIKMKADKVNNLLSNTSEQNFTIDLSQSSFENVKQRSVYIPLSNIGTLAALDKNLIIRVPEGEFTVKPGTIKLEDSTEIDGIKSKSTIKEAYLYIEIDDVTSKENKIPSNLTKVSNVDTLGVKVVGTTNADSEIEQQIKNILDYYINVGLLSLQSTGADKKSTSGKLNDAIDNIALGVQSNLTTYLNSYLEGKYGLISDRTDITSFDSPMNTKLSLNSNSTGLKSGYFYSDNIWRSMVSTYSPNDNTVSFNLLKPGKFTVLSKLLGNIIGNTSQTASLPDEVKAFITTYDVSDIFSATSGADLTGNVNVNDTVLVIEKVLQKSGMTSNSDNIADKAGDLGLKGVINFNNAKRVLTREDLAALVIGVYELKTGIDIKTLKPDTAINIKDSGDISKDRDKAVKLSIGLKLLSLDAKSNFKPKGTCSRQLMLIAIAKLVALVGG
jgi:hypothetical protein